MGRRRGKGEWRVNLIHVVIIIIFNSKQGMKKSKIANASTSHKLTRNLKEQFEQFTIRDENSQNQDLNHSKFSDSLPPHKSTSKQPLKLKQVPKSYLLAMESLQQVVQSKDAQIDSLKEELVQKETDLLNCETRINETLKKYKTLAQICEQKEVQNKLLRSQIKQLHKDKEVALKQAAQLLHHDLRQINAQEIMQNHIKDKIFRERSKTVLPSYNQASLGSFPSVNMSKPSQYFPKNYMQVEEISEASLLRTPMEPLSFVSPLTTQRSKNKDYISYQRQILRNEKELVALQYRVECLQRKLGTEINKEIKEQIKVKLKKLHQDIGAKQKYLLDLKKN